MSQAALIEGFYCLSHENFESIQRLSLIGLLSPSERKTASQYGYQFCLRDVRMNPPHSVRAYAGDHIRHSDASSHFLIRLETTRQARIDPLHPLMAQSFWHAPSSVAERRFVIGEHRHLSLRRRKRPFMAQTRRLHYDLLNLIVIVFEVA